MKLLVGIGGFFVSAFIGSFLAVLTGSEALCFTTFFVLYLSCCIYVFGG